MGALARHAPRDSGRTATVSTGGSTRQWLDRSLPGSDADLAPYLVSDQEAMRAQSS